MLKPLFLLSLSLILLPLSGCLDQQPNQGQILPTTGIFTIELNEEGARNLTSLQMDVASIQMLPTNSSRWISLTTDL